MKISLKFFLKIFGSAIDRSSIESKHIFKLSWSLLSKHNFVVSKILKIKSLNCFTSFLLEALHNNSFTHSTVFALRDKELQEK